MPVIPYATANPSQRAKADEAARELQSMYNLPVMPCCVTISVDSSRPNKVDKRQCLFKYPAGCQSNKVSIQSGLRVAGRHAFGCQGHAWRRGSVFFG